MYAKKRVNQRAPFLCEAYFEGGGISGLTIISSLSKKGCKLDTSSSIAKGTTLLIKIKLQPGCKIEVLGEVIYTVPGSGIGIEFIALDTESERLIEDLVEKVGSQCVENV
ncbi:MAG: PilZ domain-containing protein [Blastocatellia bacterium]|nr:PilZ domain-containing protein [Blastocatellia bacterium]